MRLKIDPAKCIASGACRLAAPAVFGQDEEGVVTLLDASPPLAQQAAARAAALACPAAVISVKDD
jgi:ferredoxin